MIYLLVFAHTGVLVCCHWWRSFSNDPTPSPFLNNCYMCAQIYFFFCMLPEADAVLWPKQSVQSRSEPKGKVHPPGQIIREVEQTQKAQQGKKQDEMTLTEQNLYLFYIFTSLFIQGCDFCVTFAVANGNSTIFKPLHLWPAHFCLWMSPLR